MQPEEIYQQYIDLQHYVGWSREDADRIRTVRAQITPHIYALIDDFYEEIQRHPQARRVITGGAAQVERLKGTLRAWLEQLFQGTYDQAYVLRRWQVGLRHVEIGLDQVYTNAALSRLRNGLLEVLCRDWQGSPADLLQVVKSLNRLLDLDLAIIEHAYQSEFMLRQQRAERLITIGKMAGGLAHELRNPLNVVKTSVYYLLNARSPSPEKIKEHLDRIERHVGSADNVITALSDFAKLPMPEFAPFELSPFLNEVLEGVTIPAGIELRREYQDSQLCALGDQRQLLVVFSNLVRNAIDAMPQGGQLALSVQEADGHVQVQVRDTGVGIAVENLRRIMEPLFSTKARGIGLGLALARSIVENHQGQLAVTSREGQGTTFTVHLPAADL